MKLANLSAHLSMILILSSLAGASEPMCLNAPFDQIPDHTVYTVVQDIVFPAHSTSVSLVADRAVGVYCEAISGNKSIETRLKAGQTLEMNSVNIPEEYDQNILLGLGLTDQSGPDLDLHCSKFKNDQKVLTVGEYIQHLAPYLTIDLATKTCP